ncbi:MAG: phosphatidate cytidylyltransferase [Helicobacteraceae bacterium]|jgi:phosphatidate cytidylyltransferase|nr:phosphatidate cytidylyltransferase [Helicobacteraceae bacterium]
MGLLARLKSDAKRWRTALILLLVAAIAIAFHSVWAIGALLTIIFAVASWEAIALFGYRGNLRLWCASAVAWLAAIFYPRPIEVVALAILVLAAIVALDQKRDLKVALPILYPTAPMLFLFSLYTDFGIGAYIWLLAITLSCDAGAYYAGKALGKTPFSPSSPNKTIEGVAGGITAAAIFGTIAGVIAPFSIGFWTILAITIACAIASVFGDLFESYLKRKAQVKDSGSILPGHGGALDRIDGYLFAAPVLLFALRLVAD